MSYINYTNSIDIKDKILQCPYSKCHCRIIKSKTSEKVTLDTGIEFISPGTSELTNSLSIHSSTINNKINSYSSDFLYVNDAWDFDNIAVSKEFQNDYKVPVERLLICANCERGPLGFATFKENDKDIKNLKYYLHLGSVIFNE